MAMAPDLEPLFAERAKWVRASEVRELLKYAQDPNVISFGGGLPSPEAFPVADLELIFEELLHETDTPALQYGPTNGDPLLRRALAELLRKRGISSDPERILVTHGAQQALELYGRVMMNEGDVGIVAQPTYLGIFTALGPYRPAYHGVPSDEEGIRTDALEESLEALAKDRVRPKFIYVVSTFHNPTGVTVSARRRRKIADLAATYRVPVIEDDPYYDLRFDGESLKPIASYDKEGWVLYTGTFSKVLVPSFRVGWMQGPPELINKMSLAKQGVDLFTNGFGQRVAERYLTLGLMEKHLPKIRELYRRKRDVMLAALDESFPEGNRWTRPQGGLFLWTTIGREIDTKDLLAKAAARGVIYIPGHGFYAGKPEANHMRLNFSFPSDANIRKGIGILGSVVREAAAGTPILPARRPERESPRALVKSG